MKHIIENVMKLGGGLNLALSHIFATLGNGIDLDNRGYIIGNYRSEEVYPLPKAPEPMKWIYPWSDTPRFQPFRDLAGCRDAGFKETAQHFIDSIMITPDSVDNIKKWKENIEMVREVLIDTPTITDRYTDPNDIDGFLESIDLDPTINNIKDGSKIEAEKSVKKITYFDVQWSDCPKEVEAEVVQIWSINELGNDNYIYKTRLDQELFEEYPRIYYWLKYNGVQQDEDVIIHWWW